MSKRRIIHNNQSCTDNDENPQYLFNRVIYYENNNYYYADVQNMKVNPYTVVGKKIHIENIYPKTDNIGENVTEFIPNNNMLNVYEKTPNLLFYPDLQKSKFSDNITKEVRILESLKLNPHPNIIKYLGCKIDHHTKQVKSIYLEKHKSTLHKIANHTKLNAKDKNKIIQQLISAVKHLHNIGYIHGDINPNNILIDMNKNAILIDFDSSQKIGKEIEGKCGTPGWEMPTDEKIANTAMDFFAIGKVARLLEQN
jgi:serine/threonine protein kinase